MLVPAGSTHGTLGGGSEPISEAEGEAGAAGGHPVPPPLLHLTQTQSIHSLPLLTTLLAINPRKGLAWPSRSAQGSSDGKWDFLYIFFPPLPAIVWVFALEGTRNEAFQRDVI